MNNLINSDVFKKHSQTLIDVGILTKDYRLSDKYYNLFYSYKGQYVMESLMYPMFMIFQSTDLGQKETEYFHIILNIFLSEQPKYLPSIEAEKKFAERRVGKKNESNN